MGAAKSGAVVPGAGRVESADIGSNGFGEYWAAKAKINSIFRKLEQKLLEVDQINLDGLLGIF